MLRERWMERGERKGRERRRKGGNGEEKELAVEKREGERMVAEKRGNKERQ